MVETYVAVIVLLEVLVLLAAVWGFLHEAFLIRVEHAFVKALGWTLWERITHKEVDYFAETRRKQSR